MKFSRVSDYFEKLENTSSRLTMAAILADLINESSAEEIDKICYLLLGELGPHFDRVDFAIAEKMMFRVISAAFNVPLEEVENKYKVEGDLGKTAEHFQKDKKGGDEEVTVNEVYEALLKLASASGAGSQDTKVLLFSKLLNKLDRESVNYTVRIALGTMRLGFSDKTLIDALSWSKKGDKSESEKISYRYNIHPDIGKVACLYKKGGLAELKKLTLEVGVPVLPALTQRIPTPELMIEKMGKVIVEPKYDGTRVQLHFSRLKKSNRLEIQGDLGIFGKREFFVKTFTRNLEDTTEMFPDLISFAEKQIQADEVILDGEAIGYDPKTQKLLSFQETIQRKRKHSVLVKAKEIPLRLFLFDILFLNGETLIDLPFSRRRALLEKTISSGDGIKLAPEEKTSDPKTLKELFEKARKEGFEGVVVKKIDGVYEVGARGFSWVKYKHEEEEGSLADSLDVVVLGYYKGRGKRTDFGIGAFLVGVYDDTTDSFLTVAKIGTGLSDEQWVEIRKRCDLIKIESAPKGVLVAKALTPDVWVKPKLVVEIKADEITLSPLHTARDPSQDRGFALRFPRLVNFRDDKSSEEATSLTELTQMYKKSSR